MMGKEPQHFMSMFDGKMIIFSVSRCSGSNILTLFKAFNNSHNNEISNSKTTSLNKKSAMPGFVGC